MYINSLSKGINLIYCIDNYSKWFKFEILFLTIWIRRKLGLLGLNVILWKNLSLRFKYFLGRIIVCWDDWIAFDGISPYLQVKVEVYLYLIDLELELRWDNFHVVYFRVDRFMDSKYLIDKVCSKCCSTFFQ